MKDILNEMKLAVEVLKNKQLTDEQIKEIFTLMFNVDLNIHTSINTYVLYNKGFNAMEVDMLSDKDKELIITNDWYRHELPIVMSGKLEKAVVLQYIREDR